MTFNEDILTVRQKRRSGAWGLSLRKTDTISAAAQRWLFSWGTADRWTSTGLHRSILPDPLRLAAALGQEKIPFATGQIARGTLYGSAYGVQVSFLEYAYPLLKPVLIWKDYNCPLASLADLACMKLAAIAQRGSKKDFVDIYALGQKTFSLTDMLAFYRRKYDVQDIGHILYGLSYFDQAEKERMPRMIWNVDWKEIRKTVQSWVKTCAR